MYEKQNINLIKKGEKMKNFFAILISFFISFASVASPHPLIDQGIEDLYSSHSLTEEQTLTEEQIKITEQIMETLRTEPFQVVFLDQEGKCFTYHNVSGDVSACDIQAENLVHNIMAKGVLLNNISEENGSSHLQSKGVIPIGQVAGFGEQVAGFGEQVAEQVAGFGEQVAEQVAGFGEQVAGFGEWVCSSVDPGIVGVTGAVLGALGTTIALESLGWLAGTTSIVKMAVY